MTTKTQDHQVDTTMNAAMRSKCAPLRTNPSSAAVTLGAARLKMANERTTSCSGVSHDYPAETPFVVVVMLALACSSVVLIVAFAMRLLGIG